MLAGLLVNALTVCGAVALWARARPRGASIFVGTGIIATAQVIAVMLATGWLGQMRAATVMLTSSGVSLGMILIGRQELSVFLKEVLASARRGWAELRTSGWAMAALV